VSSDYEQDSIKLAAVVATELKELCLNARSSLADPVVPSTPDTLESVRNAKAARVDAKELAKTVWVGVGLSPN
jgi:hypothetical protein